MGFLAGALGIGGAALGTPLLKLFTSLPAKQALATPLPAVIPAAVSGALAYSKSNLIQFKTARYALAFAIPFSVLGSTLTSYANPQMLMVLTGLLLMQTGLSFILKYLKPNPNLGKQSSHTKQENMLDKDLLSENSLDKNLLDKNSLDKNSFYAFNKNHVLLGGALAGFLSGFLAVGGGIILVPTFYKLCKLNIKQSLATSLFCVAILAIPGVVTHYLLDHIHLPTAFLLCLAVIPAGYTGALSSVRLKNRTLEIMFGTLLLAFAIFFTYKSFLEK